jgi:hypothetical protein
MWSHGFVLFAVYFKRWGGGTMKPRRFQDLICSCFVWYLLFLMHSITSRGYGAGAITFSIPQPVTTLSLFSLKRLFGLNYSHIPSGGYNLLYVCDIMQ